MIIFTGDICLCDKAYDIGYGVGSQILDGKVQPFFLIDKNKDDVWIGNFEGVVSDITNKTDYSRDSFRISTNTFKKVNNIIDYWGIANNHVMEHGKEAYSQMKAILNKTGGKTFGSKHTKSIKFVHQTQNIAITGFNLRTEDTQNEPLYWLQPEIKELENEYNSIIDTDYKVAYIHWGVEYVNHPSLDQIRLAHYLIDLGYDLVIGMHPHILQGYEVYKNKYIFYSLGNFVFNMPYEPCLFSAIITCDVMTRSIQYRYIRINKQFQPQIIDEMDVPVKYRFDTLNKAINNIPNIENYIREFHSGLNAYRKSNNLDIIKNILKYKPTIFFKTTIDFFKRRLHNIFTNQ